MRDLVEIGPETETIIWDLDGTILDSFEIFEECLNETLRNAGKTVISEEILRSNHHGTLRDSITDALRATDQATNETELGQILASFLELDNAYIKDVDHHLFEDAIDLAQRAHGAGKRQIIVTNRAHGINRQNGSPRNMVENSRLCGIIDTVICGDDSEYRKPLHQVLEAQFGQDLSVLGELVVIGDQFVDAEFARNLGGRAILVARTAEIVHLDKLGGWKDHIDIVASLTNVKVA